MCNDLGDIFILFFLFSLESDNVTHGQHQDVKNEYAVQVIYI